MNVFRFKAYDNKGVLHSGNIYMSSEDEVIAFLVRNSLTPLEVKPLPQNIFYRLSFRFFSRITFQQKIFLIRNLYLILKSGLGLEKGISALIEQSKGGLKDFLFYLNYSIQRGDPIYKAFASFPHAFSIIEVETLKSGEISGNLLENLERWGENLERQRQIRNEIISNLLYPAIVLMLSFAVIILLITFVLPRVGLLLRETINKPPLFTRFLLSLSSFVNSNLTVFIYANILFLLILIILFSLRRTRIIMFDIIIRLPLFSKIYLYLSLSQALFVMYSLLKSGISLVYSLELSANSIFHPRVKKALRNVANSLKRGKKLSDALREEKDLPQFLSSILGIASETGSLEETIKVTENYYMEEFRSIVRNVLNLLQPALLIFVGFIVGFTAIGVIVPIYQQISSQLQIERGGGLGQVP